MQIGAGLHRSAAGPPALCHCGRAASLHLPPSPPVPRQLCVLPTFTSSKPKAFSKTNVSPSACTLTCSSPVTILVCVYAVGKGRGGSAGRATGGQTVQLPNLCGGPGVILYVQSRKSKTKTKAQWIFACFLKT